MKPSSKKLIIGSALAVASGLAQAAEVKFYGHVNQAAMFADNGTDSETFIVDNTNSATRVGVKASQKTEDGLTYGAHIEVQFQSNPSNKVTPTTKTISPEFKERHVNVFVKGDFGKLSLGQGDGAANGNVERDLSGTQIISFTNPSLLGGSINFIDANSTTTVGLSKAMSDLDFESRYDRLRYDLPKLGGVDLAMSMGVKGNNNVTEFGARRLFDLGDNGKLFAAAGFSSESKGGSAGDEQTVGGSISWRAKSGLNLTAAYSTVSDDNAGNPDADFYTVKAGYIFGKNAVSLRYAVANDLVMAGDEANSIVLGYVHKPTKNLDLYAGFAIHSLDRSGANFDDISVLTTGLRVKF
ncbi:porin [Pontibacterium sp. N1Y112]|uniref:Porin n=1 Tax=Pontibacterium sinense TaxID=2781979 RepID=A0A8J7FMB7_9GAMM|nr:porin [Pontibacterium sinense]MBE9398923.1 porin [Pontibacterium sinense]